MNTLIRTLNFWMKSIQISWKRSRPTLRRLPFYAVGMLIAFLWRPEAQGQLAFSLLAIPVVWTLTMLGNLIVVPAELCSLSLQQRNLREIALRLKASFDNGNEIVTLPGDVSNDVAVDHLNRIDQWRKEARAAVSDYSLSEAILFETVAVKPIRDVAGHDQAKVRRDGNLAGVVLEMEALRLISARAAQESESLEKHIRLNLVERPSNKAAQ